MFLNNLPGVSLVNGMCAVRSQLTVGLTIIHRDKGSVNLTILECMLIVAVHSAAGGVYLEPDLSILFF